MPCREWQKKKVGQNRFENEKHFPRRISLLSRSLLFSPDLSVLSSISKSRYLDGALATVLSTVLSRRFSRGFSRYLDGALSTLGGSPLDLSTVLLSTLDGSLLDLSTVLLSTLDGSLSTLDGSLSTQQRFSLDSTAYSSIRS